MKGEFTAIIDEAPEGGYWAICPEIPGANGQGETKEQAKESLRDAVALILEDRLVRTPSPASRMLLETRGTLPFHLDKSSIRNGRNGPSTQRSKRTAGQEDSAEPRC